MSSCSAPLVRRAAVATLFLALFAFTAIAQDAAQTFRQNCMSCHTIGGGRLVGPDLKDVTKRRDRAWIVNFVSGPSNVMNSGDAYALKLKEDARGVLMPTIPGLNPTIIGSLVDLIDAESKKPKSQFAGLNIGDQPFTAADIRGGRDIFLGTRHLAAGGPPCVSCHTINGIGGLGGGQLGPDLTKVYERLQGRKGLAAWLTAPQTQTMRSVFQKRAFTNEEIVPVVAYLESVARQKPQPDDSSPLNFFFIGLGGAAGGFVIFDTVWRKRFRGVRRPLVKGDK